MRIFVVLAVLLAIVPQFVSAGRYYDARTGRFIQLDPMAQKYPSWSPYNYTLGNPLKYIDPDGQEVRFANGVSPTFQKQFAAAVEHLNEHGASGMLRQLQDSKTVYYIDEGSGGSQYNPNTRTIHWAPKMGVITNENHVLSPTTVLNHEVDHALQHDHAPDQYKKEIKPGSDTQYDTKEERRVIEGSEQETAKKLGEIKEGEVTRKDHKGMRFTTTGPTSTEPQNVIIVTPRKEDEK